MKVFISGPQRGYPDMNFAAFMAAEELLILEGHTVVNPAFVARQRGYNESTEWTKELIYSQFIDFAFPELNTCEGIYMLDGWRKSYGATAEHDFGKILDLTIFYKTPDPVYAVLREEYWRKLVTPPFNKVMSRVAASLKERLDKEHGIILP